MYLEKIHDPSDVRALSNSECRALAQEIRQRLIDVVSQRGGHLASNLGAVELTIALHRAFSAPKDKIIFDVGHQSYTHKLLTGRGAAFETLRAEGGVSGFPKREESEYDCFGTGHASTAISAALGMARARDIAGEDYSVVAVVGDGALTGGMCYEALNDAGSRPTPLVVLLNDNEMSIARNVGALEKYLTRLRGSREWNRTKKTVKGALARVPLIGAPLARGLDAIKRTLKLMLVPCDFFEALGFAYLGPVDGHDIKELTRALRDAKAMKKPVVVHAVTQKGRGYAHAERKPEEFHGVAPFFTESGKARKSAHAGVSGGETAGLALTALARGDGRVAAITAAMPTGTGLAAFAAAFPERFFDVGIAEEHAAGLAAGLAAGGMRPFFAVYASFLTRAVDQVMHDICLQNLPVTLLVDHAGFVPGDGATHQGVYDLAALRALPNLTIWQPCDAQELRAMVRKSMELAGPCVIRYPKRLPERIGEPGEIGAWRRIAEGEEGAIIGYGASVETALEVRARLEKHGVRCAVWSASCGDAPPDGCRPVAVIEEAREHGGLGEALRAEYPGLLVFAAQGAAPSAHSLEGLRRQCGQDAETVTRRILEAQQ